MAVSVGRHSRTAWHSRTAPGAMNLLAACAAAVRPFRQPLPLDRSQISALVQNRYVVVPNWLSPEDTTELQADTIALEKAGRTYECRVGTHTMGTMRLALDIRQSSQCAVYPPPPNDAGSVNARDRLIAAVAGLREQLQQQSELHLPALLPFSTELSYLLYPKGGHYVRHLDVPDRNEGWTRYGRQESDGGSLSGFSTRRVVSFLIYLNEGWDTPSHGGELRVYLASDCGSATSAGPDSGSTAPFDGARVPQSTMRCAPGTQAESPALSRSVDAAAAASPAAGTDRFEDVAPEGGTLVVFFSSEVEHMVRVTRRERQCVVGWFCEGSSHPRS
jgi:hypothetical protein